MCQILSLAIILLVPENILYHKFFGKVFIVVIGIAACKVILYIILPFQTLLDTISAICALGVLAIFLTRWFKYNK